MAHDIYAAPNFDQVIHVTTQVSTCNVYHLVVNGKHIKDGDQVSLFNQLLGQNSLYFAINQPSFAWYIDGIPDDLDDRSTPHSNSDFIGTAELDPSHFNVNDVDILASVECPFTTIEEIHCVVGPDFSKRCP